MSTVKSTIVLSENGVNVLADTIKADQGVAKKWKKCSDVLMSEGVTSSMLVKPKKGATNKFEALHNQINATIVGTFNQTVKDILVKDVKTLSDEQKESRRYWIKQMGSYFNKIAKYLASAEKALQDADRGPKTPKSKFERYHDMLVDLKEFLQKWEEPEISISVALEGLEIMQAA
jgi:hypothetical protein